MDTEKELYQLDSDLVRNSSSTWRFSRFSFWRISRFVAAFCLALLALVGTSFTPPAPAASAQENPKLTFLSLPPFLNINTSAQVTFSLSGVAGYGGLEAFFLVYPIIPSRSTFQNISQGGGLGYPLLIGQPVPLQQLSNGGGSYTLPVDIASNSNSQGVPVLPNCQGGCDGIYPIAIRIVESSNSQVVVQRSVPLAILSGASINYPLDVTPIISLSPRASAGTFRDLVSVLNSNYNLSLSVAMDGKALGNLPGTTPDKQALLAVSNWSASPNHQLLVTSYLPILPGCLRGLSGPGSLKQQIASSPPPGKVASQGIQSPVFFVDNQPTPADLKALAGLGYSDVVLPDTSYPNGLPLTLTSPVGEVAGKSTALIADPGISADLRIRDSSLASTTAISDLGQVYFDLPNSQATRVVPLVFSVANATNVSELSKFLKKLALAPFLRTQTASYALTRTPVPNDRVGVELSKSHQCNLPSSLHKAQGALAALESTKPPLSVLAPIRVDLLSSEGTIYTKRERETLSKLAITGAIGAMDNFTIVKGQAITLTSKNASIPISLLSKLDYPITLVVSISSDKLSFSKGSSQQITMAHSSITASFLASTKSLGDFPLLVTVKTPSGLVLQSAILDVRSDSFSLVGIVLSSGSLLILIIWWIRSPKKRRGKVDQSEPVGETEEMVPSEDQETTHAALSDRPLGETE